MCTIVMFMTPDGRLILAGNRDEMRTRRRAIPSGGPVALGEVRALHPTDADAGGTWIGVNDHRVAITLLNNYQEDARFTPEGKAVSRGLLVKDVLAMTSLAAIEAHLRERPLRNTRPFVLAAGQLDATTPNTATAIVATWSGTALEIESRALPILLISSSYKLEEAITARSSALSPLMGDAPPTAPEDIIGLFSQHDPEPGPFTVSMSREDARSVSHTLIDLDVDRARMIYLDGPPHEEPARHARELPMASA